MSSNYRGCCDLILGEIKTACDYIDERQTDLLVDAIIHSNKVFFIGVGRVFLSLKAFAKRLNHLGISAYCVGDINEPAITEADLLIVGSGSGESLVPLNIARKAKELNAKVIHIGSNANSSMKDIADIFIRIPVKTKLNLPDEIESNQIMSSLFEQGLYIFGDIVSMLIAQRTGKDIKTLWQYHANLE
jgi:6-phospho-3-hexuloisomerase